MCVRTAAAMGLFHILAKSQDPEGVTADELSEKSKGEKRLLGTSAHFKPLNAALLSYTKSLKVRILRILTAAGYVAEIAAERYAATPITVAMTTPPVEASIKHRYGPKYCPLHLLSGRKYVSAVRRRYIKRLNIDAVVATISVFPRSPLVRSTTHPTASTAQPRTPRPPSNAPSPPTSASTTTSPANRTHRETSKPTCPRCKSGVQRGLTGFRSRNGSSMAFRDRMAPMVKLGEAMCCS